MNPVTKSLIMLMGIVVCGCNHKPADEPQHGGAIQFGHQQIEGRAVDPTATAALSSMGVFSAITDGAWTDQAACLFASNMAVTRTLSPVSAWSYNGLLYWPSVASGKRLSFFAYAPYNSSAVVSPPKQLGTPTIAHTTTANPETGVLTISSLSQQTDLLVANAIKDRSEQSGNVLFDFKHALTQVRFQAKQDPNVNLGGGWCTITEIRLLNLYTQGTASMDYLSNPIWSGQQTPGSITLKTNTSSGTLKNVPLGLSYQWLIPSYSANHADGSAALLLLPQNLLDAGTILEIDFSFFGGAPNKNSTYSTLLGNKLPALEPGKSIVLQISYDGTFVPALTSVLAQWIPSTASGDVILD